MKSYEEMKKAIDNMTHMEMCSLYRFAPSGHPYFDSTNPISDYFMEKYKSKGSMTSEISKQIGW